MGHHEGSRAQSDLFGLFIPEEYGGLGKGCLELCIAVEELSRACLGVSTTYAANALGTYPLLLSAVTPRKEIPSGYRGREEARSLRPDRKPTQGVMPVGPRQQRSSKITNIS